MLLRTLLSILLIVISHSSIAANSCPDIKEIKRTSGEFSWTSDAPGWTGHFAYPQQAKGHSTHVTYFLEARWIQLTNLTDSQGYFECDYQGSYGDEVIRFVQAGTHANLKPKDIHWTCHLNPSFPGTQCTCSMSTELCVLEAIDNNPAPKPIYINPEATTNTGASPAAIDYFRDK